MYSPSRVSYRVLFFVLFLVVASPAFAADWPPIAPEEMSMTSLTQQPGAPAVILIRQEFADDPNNFHSVYMRIKVLTEAGLRYADVELPYGREFSITEISGRTVHADGSVVPFEGKPFEKVAAKGGGVQWKVKVFTLPDVRVGSILDFRYSLRYADRVFYAPHWEVQNELFQKQANFKFVPYEGRLRLAHDQVGAGIAWSSYLPGGVKPELHSQLMSRTAIKRQSANWVDLEMKDVPPLIEEPHMPPVSALRYRVDFYYQINRNEQEFWKEEGKYWNKEVEGFINHDKDVRPALSQFVSPSDEPEQKLRKIYSFVSQLENESYLPQRGKQEAHTIGLKRNESADDVLRQKSGTHDDLSRLFVSMVRAAGLPAWLIWVPSRDHAFFQPTYLSTDQFAAEIPIVQLNGKEVFLDPGTKYCPYGQLDWRYTDIRGLRQSASKGTEFGEIPVTDYKETRVQRVARVHLTSDGSYEGTVGVAFFGIEAMLQRQRAGRTDEAGRKKELEELVKRWLPGGSEATLTNEPEWEKTEAQLFAQFKVSGPLAISAGKRWIVPVHMFEVNEKPRFAAARRINPVYFSFPWTTIDEVHITLPPEAAIESLPPNDKLNLEYALYKTEQKEEKPGTIYSRRDLIMGGIAFPRERYDEVKGFFDKVKTGDDQQVIIKAASHAQGG
jgi:Domain of Unknown Function with PDB structure (DUF3857)/Transglutaminase-like superfamily